MKTLTALTSSLLIITASFVSFNTSANTLSPHMEQALVDTCKAAMSNKMFRFNKTLKTYHLNEQTVALGVVCNGEDIITFAQNNGADKTADHLAESIGQSSITDLAGLEIVKYEVNFVVSPE